MSRCYQIDKLVFYPHKNAVRVGDSQLNIRPKTAELLHELVKADGKIVSKSDLLERVWSDVIVEDHVIFQSISELRKLFDDPKVIQTHPRKGYSIAAPVAVIEESYPDPAQDGAGNSDSRKWAGKLPAYITATVVVLGLILGVYHFNAHLDTGSSVQGSIIVLPVTNRIEDTGYSWVHYGGMDLLIRHLQPQLDAPVLATEQVLDVLQREGISSENIDESAIIRLFEVSGAQLIVSQSLSGYSRDYQLVYSFHSKQGVTRGALVGEETSELFLDLSALLLESLGLSERVDQQTYQNDFANEIMATAIDQMQAAHYEKAVTMFKAVLVTEPENLSAHRMLAKSLVYQGDYSEAEEVAAHAAKLAAEMGDAKNLGRLLFWQALSITQQQQYERALTLLKQAKANSEETNDLLYLANGSRVAGKIYLAQNQFDQARASSFEALSFYQAIQEPYGQSSLYIDLGELALATQDWDEAKASFETALEIARKSRLQQLIDASNYWLSQVAEAKNANLSSNG